MERWSEMGRVEQWEEPADVRKRPMMEMEMDVDVDVDGGGI